MNPRVWIIGGLMVAIGIAVVVPFGAREPKHIDSQQALRNRATKRWEDRVAAKWLEEYNFLTAARKKIEPLDHYVAAKTNFDFRSFEIKDAKIHDDGSAEVVVTYRVLNHNPVFLNANEGRPFDDLVTVTDHWRWENDDWFWEKVERYEGPLAPPRKERAAVVPDEPTRVHGLDFGKTRRPAAPGGSSGQGGAGGDGESGVQPDTDSGR